MERPQADFTVDDLAKGAGISRPTFYFYFPSKNAVLLCLADRVSSRVQAALRSLDGKLSGDPATHWRPRIEMFFEVSGANRAIAGPAAMARASNAEIRLLWSTLAGRWISQTAGAIQAERDRGAAPDNVPVLDLAVALTALSERVMAATFSHEVQSIPEERAIDTLVHIWESAIYCRGERTRC